MAKEKKLVIALAGNPNCGKTTLFNALTGSNQYVGNWPGVTVEKKEGQLKKHEDVTIADLPGIYSLSPYTLEEVVARNYLIGEHPDAILNIIDGTNLERNLYLTTQILELGIPVVIAINMMDVVKKNGDKIDLKQLSKRLGCPVVTISALKGEGIAEAAETCIQAAKNPASIPVHPYSEPVEKALSFITDNALQDIPDSQKRWFAIKVFERDDKILARLNLDAKLLDQIEKVRQDCETELEDDTESIITNERYDQIGVLLKGTYKKKNAGQLSTSDKIDKVVTNRWAALPIFVVIMFLVYYISVTTLGGWATDWVNDGIFGDEGWHFFGVGTSAYTQAADSYAAKHVFTPYVVKTVDAAVKANISGADKIQETIEDGSYDDFTEQYDLYSAELTAAGYDISKVCDPAIENAPAKSDYGIWVPSLPALCNRGLDAAHSPQWLHSLLVDGIIGGVGSVLGFLPQLIVLFFFLAFLESCGYMARVAFVLDRIFRKFGLSGKSFIPMLISTGCGVPGIMASRTIESERDRRMTIMTTTFMPCSAKTLIIAMVSTALFGGAWWVAPSAYFLGMASIIISGIMLKKTKPFAGDPAPFVMELPAYHWPTLGNLWKSVWERASSFLKKAGTIILLASIFIWVGTHYGMINGHFGYADFNGMDMLNASVLGAIGSVVRYIFIPLGFGGTIHAAEGGIGATIATVMGLVAKEEVVGVFGVIDFKGLTALAGYSYLAFNLLAAPCFAAIGAMRREMNNAKWTWFAVLYQITYAYAIALMIYQFGSAIQGNIHVVPFIFAVLVLGFILYMLFRPYHESTTLNTTVDIRSKKEKREQKKAAKAS